MCLPCHASVDVTTTTHGLLHPPVESTCTTCHSSHESRVRNLLRSDAQLQVCAGCHADFLTKAQEKPFRHLYFDPVGLCGSCHYAHHNGDRKYLRENISESCLTCHDLPIRMRGRVLENVAETVRDSKVVHGAMGKGSCATCHTPHGSDQSSLLVSGYPGGSYQPYKTSDYSLCWNCHNPALVEDTRGLGKTQFRSGTANLHKVHVVDLRRGRACHICHTAHASNQPHLLRDEIRFGQWNAPMGYTSLSDGGSCQTPCHSPREYHRLAADAGAPPPSSSQ